LKWGGASFLFISSVGANPEACIQMGRLMDSFLVINIVTSIYSISVYRILIHETRATFFLESWPLLSKQQWWFFDVMGGVSWESLQCGNVVLHYARSLIPGFRLLFRMLCYDISRYSKDVLFPSEWYSY
jgi:hypothetical protein